MARSSKATGLFLCAPERRTVSTWLTAAYSIGVVLAGNCNNYTNFK